ncbi:hypothetical protein AB3S75_019807 [Citrus x aurantiifolia]
MSCIHISCVIRFSIWKERIEPENTCVLSGDGTILSLPSRKPYPHKPTYETSNAGAGIHSHGIEYFLVTMINLMSKEFQWFCEAL